MLLILELPGAVARYRELGGILDFAFFADTNGSREDLLSAVGLAVDQGTNGRINSSYHTVDHAQLESLASRELEWNEFLGSKVNSRTGDLLCNGDYTMTNGQKMADPSYRQLGKLRRKGVTIVSGVSTASSDGGFGQAFAYQPYPLRGDPDRVQKVFDAVYALILPPGKRCHILDWSGPQLPILSNYFLGEHVACWSEYLYTVHVAEDQWLAVICGSAWD